MRSLSRIGIGIVASALALTACATEPASEGSPNGSTDSADPVTITYSNFISDNGNEDNLATIIEAFNNEYPYITVEVETLPYADYFTTLQIDVAAGTGADVFDIEYANYPAFQSLGLLAPLEGVDTSVYRGDIAEAYSTNGTMHALPTSFSAVVMYYNATLFDEAGIAYPDGTWTWDEVYAAAETLTDADAGVWGLYQPISFYEYYKALAQAGGQFLNADGTAVAFNSPEGVAAAEWLIRKSGDVMPTEAQGAGTPDFDSGLWADGKLGMWVTGIWNFGVAADSSFDWDIVVEPGKARAASAVFSNAVAVAASSEHKEAAQLFAEFLTSSQTMVDVRLGSGWELPAISNDAQLAAYLDQTSPANRQAVFDSLNGIALPPVIKDGQAQMQDIISEQLGEAAAGRITVDQALSNAEAAINSLLG
ncbi:MAG: sugar ABC transporter substrate-binding protein [Actinobacteria bacterium HGW-Actinobacteria-4]|nr:MAG: sugar ABC transporter substrate-binding protein [Actinobacteria bacterium HGW-Actinobacteria-4]